jgi:ubiquinone/menaquinone biosynthesis C-methylase UbiE
MKFPESQLAHRLLDGKRGVEVGPSAHNPFGLNSVFVGRDTTGTVYEHEEEELCGESTKLHFVCEAGDLPFKDSTCDYVLVSHVLEHCYDVISTIAEWLRVIRPGGLLFIAFPHKERMFDKDRPRTTLSELIGRIGKTHDKDEHHTVWITEDGLELCRYLNLNVIEVQDPDEKVSNGFVIVIQK